VWLISPVVDDIAHLSDDRIQLFVGSVEVRRNPDSRSWSKIDQELPPHQLTRYFVRVRRINRDRASPIIGAIRRGQRKTAPAGKLNQPRAQK